MFCVKLFTEVISVSKIMAVFLIVITTITSIFSSIFGGGIVIKPTEERLNDNENIIGLN